MGRKAEGQKKIRKCKTRYKVPKRLEYFLFLSRDHLTFCLGEKSRRYSYQDVVLVRSRGGDSGGQKKPELR